MSIGELSGKERPRLGTASSLPDVSEVDTAFDSTMFSATGMLSAF